MIFETHAHYEDEKFNEDRDTLLTSMRTHGIDKIVNVGSSLITVKKVLSWLRNMILYMLQSVCIQVR